MSGSLISVLLIVASLAGASVSSGSPGAIVQSEWDSTKEKCISGLHPQPDGPFAVLLFCEDALGIYLSVVHLQPIGAPSAAEWSLKSRYWFEPLWGDDITGFRWSRDGRTLFVTTSETYGSGGAFALALRERKAVQIRPAKAVSVADPGPGFTLRDVRQK